MSDKVIVVANAEGPSGNLLMLDNCSLSLSGMYTHSLVGWVILFMLSVQSRNLGTVTALGSEGVCNHRCLCIAVKVEIVPPEAVRLGGYKGQMPFAWPAWH